MGAAECPHCKACFEVYDLNESGSYSCPTCNRTIWLEVEYSIMYTASCLDDNHTWEQYRDTQHLVCSACGSLRVKNKDSWEIK